MNLAPVNSALLSTRLGALGDELFLLKLAVVPDGTAALEVTAQSCLPLGRSRDSACDFLAINGVRRRRLNPSADAGGRPAGQKAALWVRRRR